MYWIIGNRTGKLGYFPTEIVPIHLYSKLVSVRIESGQAPLLFHRGSVIRSSGQLVVDEPGKQGKIVPFLTFSLAGFRSRIGTLALRRDLRKKARVRVPV